MCKRILSMVLFLVFLLSVAASALDYSADIINVSIVGEEEEVVKGKGYFSKDKWRSEVETDEGEKAITIFRYDKEVMWVLMPEEKMYMEQKIPMEKIVEALSERMKELQEEKKIKVYRKVVGKEKISGILCNKIKITTKDLTEKKPRTYTMYQWISVKHRELIMKTAFEDGSYTQLKNVNFKKQPAYLFEVPKGYKKYSMEGFMIRGVEEEEVEEEEREEGERIKEEVEEEEEEIKREEMPRIEIPFDLPF